MKIGGRQSAQWITPAIVGLSIACAPMMKASDLQTSESLTAPVSVMLQQAGDLQREGKYPQSVAIYRLLLDPRLRLDIERRAYITSQIANTNLERGMYAEAVKTSREAVEMLKQAQKEHTRTFVTTECILADALYNAGYDQEARSIAEQALSIGRQVLDMRSREFAFVLITLAQILRAAGKLGQAEHLCQSALNILQQTQTAEKADLARAYEDLATNQALRGHLKKALVTIEMAVTTWSQVPARQHPSIVYALSIKLLVYEKLKAFPQGEELAPRLLALLESEFGPDRPERMSLLNNLAAFYIAEQKYNDAEPLLREAVEIGRRRLSRGHPITRNVMLNYSHVLTKLNRKDEATQVRAASEVVRTGASGDALSIGLSPAPRKRRTR